MRCGSIVVALHWRFSRQLGVTVGVVSARWPSLRVHQPLGIAKMARSLGPGVHATELRWVFGACQDSLFTMSISVYIVHVLQPATAGDG